MALTRSFEKALPQSILARYDFIETRNAARILQATNEPQFRDLQKVLGEFRVDERTDIRSAGGNESEAAARLNSAFRSLGWAEASYRLTLTSKLVLSAPGLQTATEDEQVAASYKVDNVKGRVALDVEWHAKDGNLDRDIAAYRSFYDAGIIDCAVMVTTTQQAMRAWVLRVNPASKKFGTTTTTNLEKATPRLVRGDGGGCPILVASICDRTS